MGNTAGALEVRSGTKNTLGFLASPKAQSGGFGTSKSTPGSDNYKGKGRSTVAPLKTLADPWELRIAIDSEGDMDCD